jgi:hypothetical protein
MASFGRKVFDWVSKKRRHRDSGDCTADTPPVTPSSTEFGRRRAWEKRNEVCDPLDPDTSVPEAFRPQPRELTPEPFDPRVLTVGNPPVTQECPPGSVGVITIPENLFQSTVIIDADPAVTQARVDQATAQLLQTAQEYALSELFCEVLSPPVTVSCPSQLTGNQISLPAGKFKLLVKFSQVPATLSGLTSQAEGFARSMLQCGVTAAANFNCGDLYSDISGNPPQPNNSVPSGGQYTIQTRPVPFGEVIVQVPFLGLTEGQLDSAASAAIQEAQRQADLLSLTGLICEFANPRIEKPCQDADFGPGGEFYGPHAWYTFHPGLGWVEGFNKTEPPNLLKSSQDNWDPGVAEMNELRRLLTTPSAPEELGEFSFSSLSTEFVNLASDLAESRKVCSVCNPAMRINCLHQVVYEYSAAEYAEEVAKYYGTPVVPGNKSGAWNPASPAIVQQTVATPGDFFVEFCKYKDDTSHKPPVDAAFAELLGLLNQCRYKNLLIDCLNPLIYSDLAPGTVLTDTTVAEGFITASDPLTAAQLAASYCQTLTDIPILVLVPNDAITVCCGSSTPASGTKSAACKPGQTVGAQSGIHCITVAFGTVLESTKLAANTVATQLANSQLICELEYGNVAVEDPCEPGEYMLNKPGVVAANTFFGCTQEEANSAAQALAAQLKVCLPDLDIPDLDGVVMSDNGNSETLVQCPALESSLCSYRIENSVTIPAGTVFATNNSVANILAESFGQTLITCLVDCCNEQQTVDCTDTDAFAQPEGGWGISKPGFIPQCTFHANTVGLANVAAKFAAAAAAVCIEEKFISVEKGNTQAERSCDDQIEGLESEFCRYQFNHVVTIPAGTIFAEDGEAADVLAGELADSLLVCVPECPNTEQLAESCDEIFGAPENGWAVDKAESVSAQTFWARTVQEANNQAVLVREALSVCISKDDLDTTPVDTTPVDTDNIFAAIAPCCCWQASPIQGTGATTCTNLFPSFLRDDGLPRTDLALGFKITWDSQDVYITEVEVVENLAQADIVLMSPQWRTHLCGAVFRGNLICTNGVPREELVVETSIQAPSNCNQFEIPEPPDETPQPPEE